jgi:hypothetical protein
MVVTPVPIAVIRLLRKKYTLLDTISFLEFDHDFDILKTRLEKHQKEHYDQNERIIIAHGDTDFYFEHCAVGVNLLNFFTVVDSLDIPKFVFLFYTNHFGIAKEIEKICKDPNDRPNVIESIINNFTYSPNGYRDHDSALDEISHPALCMMNMTRSHRYAMYGAIKDLPDHKILKSFTSPLNE